MEEASRQPCVVREDDYAAFRDWDTTRADVAGGHSRVWRRFELIFDLSTAGIFTYQLFLGEGDRHEVQHGAFPYGGRPLYPSEAFVSLVGEGWRWENYRYSKGGQELPVQIFGEVLPITAGSTELPKGKAEIQLFTQPAGPDPRPFLSIFWVDLGAKGEINSPRGVFLPQIPRRERPSAIF